VSTLHACLYTLHSDHGFARTIYSLGVCNLLRCACLHACCDGTRVCMHAAMLHTVQSACIVQGALYCVRDWCYKCYRWCDISFTVCRLYLHYFINHTTTTLQYIGWPGQCCCQRCEAANKELKRVKRDHVFHFNQRQTLVEAMHFMWRRCSRYVAEWERKWLFGEESE